MFLSVVWHPLTAEDPLVSKWCNAKFPQICSDEYTNSSNSQNVGLPNFSTDTTSPSSIAEASKLVETKLKGKGLNLIINNAGVNIPGSLAETGKQEMVDVYTTNVVGPMLIAKVAEPSTLQQMIVLLGIFVLFSITNIKNVT